MYEILIYIHSWMRWLILVSLCYALVSSITGYKTGRIYSPIDNKIRHWTATIAHIQLIVGFVLYINSPLVKYYWNKNTETQQETLFFGLIHLIIMLLAIVIITIGSAKAKRKLDAHSKFRTQWIYFAFALLIILIAIPWPFSPLAHRPLLR